MLLLNMILRGVSMSKWTQKYYYKLILIFIIHFAYENNKVASKWVQVQEKETFCPLSNISSNIFQKINNKYYLQVCKKYPHLMDGKIMVVNFGTNT
jgi:hypothetical protein